MAISLVVLALWGQPAPMPTLRDVLTSVEEHHPMVRAAMADVAAAQGRLRQSRGAFDLYVAAKGQADPLGFYTDLRSELSVSQPTPLWGLEFTAGYAYGRDQAIYAGKKTTGSAGEVNAGVMLPVFRGRATDEGRTGISVAENETGMAIQRQAQQLVELKLGAAEAYWKWQAEGAKLGVIEEMVKLAESRRRFLERGVAEGQLAPIELVDNKRLVVGRQEEAVDARRKLQTQAQKLSLYLRDVNGRPMPPLSFTSSQSLTRPEDPLPGASQRDRIELAWARHPALAELRLKRSALSAKLALAENDAQPQVDLGVLASKDLGTAQTYGGDDPKFAATLETELMLNLTVSLPVQRRKALGKADALRADIRSLDSKQLFLQEKIQVNIINFELWFAAAGQRSKLAEEALRLAREVEAAERRKFSLGSSSILKINLREEASAKAAKRHIEALAEVHLARSALMAALLEL